MLQGETKFEMCDPRSFFTAADIVTRKAWKIQAWTEIRILTSAVRALHPNRRGHIQARVRNAKTASIIHLCFNVS